MRKEKLRKFNRVIVMVLFMLSIGLPSVFSRNINNNNDCKSSQYGEGKAAVETNCVISSTGWSWTELWWSSFEDGMAKCCASVMDCAKTCDKDDESVCHRV